MSQVLADVFTYSIFMMGTVGVGCNGSIEGWNDCEIISGESRSFTLEAGSIDSFLGNSGLRSSHFRFFCSGGIVLVQLNFISFGGVVLLNNLTRCGVVYRLVCLCSAPIT